MQVVRLFPTDETEWERQFEGLAEGGLCQSHFYARVIERIDHAESLFLKVVQDGRAIAYCLMLHKHLVDSHNPGGSTGILKWLSSSVDASLECLDGPVMISQCEADLREAIACLLDWVENYYREKRITAIRWLGMSKTSAWIADDSLALAFLSRGYEKSSWATFLVDLTQDENLLWRNLNHAARKCIRKCLEQEIRIEQINRFEDFRHSFYEAYANAQAAYGKQASPLSVFQVMFDEDVGDRYTYFVAKESSGETLATLGMYCFGDVATEIASMLAPKARARGIPAQDLLHWEVLRWAKAKGCHTFDLAGVTPQPRDSKEAGIRRFKEKWGGRYVEYHRFEKVIGLGRAFRVARLLTERVKHAVDGLR